MAAIYMWRGLNQLVLTTTLYPVDILDRLEYSMDIQPGRMDVIPFDNVTVSKIEFGDGTYIQKRWFYEHDLGFDNFSSFLLFGDGTYVQKRWFFEETIGPDNFSSFLLFGDGTYSRKKVEGDTPDQLLQLNADISQTSSMTAV